MNKILNIDINFEDVIVRMGANKYKTIIDDKTKTLITESIKIAKRIIKPKYAVCFADTKIKDNKILLDSFVIESSDILKLLKDSVTVCGIIATIGDAIDEKINSLSENKQIASSYIFDAVGSVAIESFVDNICGDIKSKNGKCTMRFSPGYGDWHIKAQKDFLKWLGAEKINIKLSKTFQMSPRKSVSAIFGIQERI